MIPMTIKIKERWGTERGLMAAHKKASKEAWMAAGTMWHLTFRDNRFTPAHARKAGYAKRQGEESGISQKGFWSSYTGRKLREKHHRNPLQWSGDTRKRVRSATITATGTKYKDPTSFTSVDAVGGGCKVAYPGAYTLNFKYATARSGYAKYLRAERNRNIDMADEFRRIIPDEAEAIARTYDRIYDSKID